MLKSGFRKDAKAAAAVEAAIILPVLIFLILAIIQYTIIYYYSSKLTSATATASRKAVTGNLYGANSREDLIVREIKNEFSKSVFAISLEKLTIRVFSMDNYNFSDYNLDNAPNNYGGSGQYMLYQVEYEPIAFIPGLAAIWGKDGKFLIKSRVVVKNEKY